MYYPHAHPKIFSLDLQITEDYAVERKLGESHPSFILLCRAQGEVKLWYIVWVMVKQRDSKFECCGAYAFGPSQRTPITGG